jgi:NADH:ubiquinone oxidoreductase subunit F (NADH-binding)
MAFETLEAAGSQLGTGAIVVMDESTCMVEAARRTTKFFRPRILRSLRALPDWLRTPV